MLAVFDEMQNDDIVAIASADTDYLTLIEFLKAKEKTVLGFAQYQPSLSPQPPGSLDHKRIDSDQIARK